ncbi:protein of unknown function [Paraburkholderia dioscoreae]|uniref:Uncharacterized protein n=1 Tax=Paraburkholderia dioscoreae TaxID=2604047 RepID=A0A5Q4ZHJ7_9BURK|nr:protein of unknown function [Paraburkholderia dioscoreae]
MGSSDLNFAFKKLYQMNDDVPKTNVTFWHPCLPVLLTNP